MKEVLIILDGLMEKAFEEIDIKNLILGDYSRYFKIIKGDFSVKGHDIDSLNCIMNMLGYSPLENDISDRAFYEGLSQGIVDYKSILRCNIIKIRDNRLYDFTGGNLSDNIGDIIQDIYIKDGYVHNCSGYKNLLVVNSDEDLSKVKLYPPHFNLGCNINNIMPDNSYLREIINNSIEFFRCAEMDSLSLWPWGYSRGVALNSFENKYGKTLGVVSGIDLVSGMAIALGGKSVKTGSSTGDSDTNLREKLYSSKKLIRDMDTTIVHINGFDELSHRGDFQGKIEFIKKVQNQFLKPLLTNIIASGNCHITITCDHRTDSFTGKHEDGWVPVIKN